MTSVKQGTGIKACYVTFDKLDPNSGAGKVCLNEIAALKEVLGESNVQVISRENIPGADKYEFNPFLYDYFASQVIEKCDILHLSCSPGLAILQAARLKNGGDLCYSVTNIVAHDLQVSIDEHERYYGAGSYNYKHNTDPVLHKYLIGHASLVNTVLTPSNGSAEWIKKNITAKNVKVIPHGCDLADPIATPTKFNVGYLGAFGPDKGLPYLALAWNHFEGNGELLFGGSCGQHIGLLGTVKNSRATGWLENVKDFYNQLAVYVQPSVTEAFGIETLEAMAYGIPVICSSGAGSADCIEDGVSGFVVPPRDPKALLEKINLLYENPEIWESMSKAARIRSAKFRWPNIKQTYVDFWREHAPVEIGDEKI